ncbi:MAG: hypothetical protein NT009_03945 [Proteobacteria bacterium]|nr:hypothetical protein [Pseudomonadota bacterium]
MSDLIFEITNFSFFEQLEFGRIRVIPKNDAENYLKELKEKANRSGFFLPPDNTPTHEVTIGPSSCRESNQDMEFVCWLLSFFSKRLVLGWDRVYHNPTNVVNKCLIPNKSNLEKVLKHFLERYDCAYYRKVRSKYFKFNPKEEFEEQAILRAILYQHVRQYDYWSKDWIHAAIAFMEHDNLKMVLANHSGDYELDGKKLFNKYGLYQPKKANEFRDLRNEFFHRGTFYGVLFDLNGNIKSNDLMKEMTHLRALNQRLVCLAFDYENKFTKTPWDDRATHPFDII